MVGLTAHDIWRKVTVMLCTRVMPCFQVSVWLYCWEIIGFWHYTQGQAICGEDIGGVWGWCVVSVRRLFWQSWAWRCRCIFLGSSNRWSVRSNFCQTGWWWQSNDFGVHWWGGWCCWCQIILFQSCLQQEWRWWEGYNVYKVKEYFPQGSSHEVDFF